MGWLIEALANVFLELLGDLMAWTTTLITGLSLDIGMETELVNGRYIPHVPEIGTLINPVGIHGYLLEKTFPQAASFTTLFMALGMAIIGFMFLAKMAVVFGGPFVKSESGGTIVARTGLAILGTSYSYTIFVMFESLFNAIYTKFMDKYWAITRSSESYSLSPEYTESGGATAQSYSSVRDGGSGASTATDAFKMFGKDLLEDYHEGQGLALTVITIALFILLLVSFMKLVLEIYERYVIIGVMFYTAPLAFSTIVSKESNIFTSWVQMVISEFVVMCSNLFFTGVFIAAWHAKLTTRDHALFQDPRDFVTYMFLMIAWLIIGQQFDQHLKSLGLSTAQTGRSLGGAVVAGMGTAAATISAGMGILSAGRKFAGDVATGNTKWQRAAGSQGGAVGDFFRARNNFAGLSANDANRVLSDIQKGNQASFDRMDAGRQGEALTSLASSSMGKSFDKAIEQQTGRGVASIDPSSVKLSSRGELTGRTVEGESFSLQSPGGEVQGYAKSLGNGWSQPVSDNQAEKIATSYADKQNLINSGEQSAKWMVDSNNFAQIIALNDQNIVVDRMQVPELISGADIQKIDVQG